MPDAATNDSADDQKDPLLQAMVDHLLSENTQLRSQVASLEGILDALKDDLKKRGAQTAQAMLNLAEIAGAQKQQTDATNNQTAAITRLCKALEARP